ncbi:MAG: periplasmic heavy metal sensor [Myxococcales bacterium]|nr:periplasmic heavy metal sensor [Myxococcales bacterium]
MHSAFHSWWKHARRRGHDCSAEASEHAEHDGAAWRMGGCGPGRFAGGPFGGGPFRGHGPGPFGGGGGGGGGDDLGGGPFGVRRPLRFLAHKLDLTEAQVSELARVLGDLKTERAQAQVDQRRTISALSDALEGESFDEARAKEGGDLRVESAAKLRDAVLTALRRIHATLEPDQRRRLAHLVRTGVISI